MTSCLAICVVCMYNSPNPNLVMSLPPHCEQTRTSLGVFNSLPRRLRASLSRSPSRSSQFHLLRLTPLMILLPVHVRPRRRQSSSSAKCGACGVKTAVSRRTYYTHGPVLRFGHGLFLYHGGKSDDQSSWDGLSDMHVS